MLTITAAPLAVMMGVAMRQANTPDCPMSRRDAMRCGAVGSVSQKHYGATCMSVLGFLSRRDNTCLVLSFKRPQTQVAS
ncbi:hypothetical protein HYQ46_000770 [Verticillium longisporum]|nr:hypothetical protein HYQ46_000770 [Verticillium longisporum]